MQEIFVETVVGKKIKLNVSPNDTIKNVKEMIEMMENILVNQQKIVYSGKPVLDELTILDYKVPDKGVMYMVLALRAG